MSLTSKKSIELLETLWFLLGNSIRNFNPDLIINDSYAFWGAPIANILNVDYINIDSATDMLSKVQDYYYGKYLKDVVSKEINEYININDIIKESNIINKKQRKKILKFTSKSNDEYKLPFVTLSHMSKKLQIGEGELDIPYKYLGFDLNKKVNVNKRNLIYISRGTINDSYNEMIIKSIISVFENENIYEVVASCGVCADAINIFSNSNINICKFVDQINCLQNSKIFISHGGITGIREAIICETPIIIFPATFHCYQVGLAVEKSGIGIMLNQHPFCKEELKKACKCILNDNKYKKNIKMLKEELINTKKENDICKIIEEYIGR